MSLPRFARNDMGGLIKRRPGQIDQAAFLYINVIGN